MEHYLVHIWKKEKTYLNDLAGNLGNGPVRLLKDKSLKCTELALVYLSFMIKMLTNSVENKDPPMTNSFNHTHKKASCVIFDSETGKGPVKLLLFSLLLSLRANKKI